MVILALYIRIGINSGFDYIVQHVVLGSHHHCEQ